jgi:hypothetical protein
MAMALKCSPALPLLFTGMAANQLHKSREAFKAGDVESGTEHLFYGTLTAGFAAHSFVSSLEATVNQGAARVEQHLARQAAIRSAEAKATATATAPKTKAEIKAARQRGVNRAKSAERKLVESGHPGTADEGWSWAERKRIAETGQYPADSRWHHINDVKRNPGLADVPDNVVPSRGGTSGHVRKYHPGGTQAGSSGDLLDRSGSLDQHMGGNP